MSLFDKFFGTDIPALAIVALGHSSLHFGTVDIGDALEAGEIVRSLSGTPTVEQQWRAARRLRRLLTPIVHVEGVTVGAWKLGREIYLAVYPLPFQKHQYTFEFWYDDGAPLTLRRCYVTALFSPADPDGDAYGKHFDTLQLERNGYDANREAVVNWHLKAGTDPRRPYDVPELQPPLSQQQLCGFVPRPPSTEWWGWARRPRLVGPSVGWTHKVLAEHGDSGAVVYILDITGTWSDAALAVLHEGCQRLLPGRCVLRCQDAGFGQLVVFCATRGPEDRNGFIPAGEEAQVVLASVARVNAIVARMHLVERGQEAPALSERTAVPAPRLEVPLMREWQQLPEGKLVHLNVGGHYYQVGSPREGWINWRRGWGTHWDEALAALADPSRQLEGADPLDVIAKAEAVPWQFGNGSSIAAPRRKAVGEERPAAAQEVFISFADEDRALAERFDGALRESGVPCWICTRDLWAGSQYPAQIARAINRSRVILVVISKHANRSKWVSREVEVADQAGLSMVPVLSDGCEPGDGLKMFFAGTHGVTILGMSPQTADAEVVRAVRASLAAVRDRGTTGPERDARSSPPVTVPATPPERDR